MSKLLREFPILRYTIIHSRAIHSLSFNAVAQIVQLILEKEKPLRMVHYYKQVMCRKKYLFRFIPLI